MGPVAWSEGKANLRCKNERLLSIAMDTNARRAKGRSRRRLLLLAVFSVVWVSTLYGRNMLPETRVITLLKCNLSFMCVVTVCDGGNGGVMDIVLRNRIRKCRLSCRKTLCPLCWMTENAVRVLYKWTVRNTGAMIEYNMLSYEIPVEP